MSAPKERRRVTNPSPGLLNIGGRRSSSEPNSPEFTPLATGSLSGLPGGLKGNLRTQLTQGSRSLSLPNSPTAPQSPKTPLSPKSPMRGARPSTSGTSLFGKLESIKLMDPRSDASSRSTSTSRPRSVSTNFADTIERRRAYDEETRAKIRTRAASNRATIKLKCNQIVNTKDLKHFKAYFDELDEDGNGSVDLNEITSHMKNSYSKDPTITKTEIRLPPSFLNMMHREIKEADHLDFTDMLKLVYPRATREELEYMASLQKPKVSKKADQQDEEEVENFNALWEVWDADGSGYLDEREFKDVLRSMGMQDHEAAAIYVDLAEQELVSREVFQQWWLDFGKKQSR